MRPQLQSIVAFLQLLLILTKECTPTFVKKKQCWIFVLCRNGSNPKTVMNDIIGTFSKIKESNKNLKKGFTNRSIYYISLLTMNIFLFLLFLYLKITETRMFLTMEVEFRERPLVLLFILLLVLLEIEPLPFLSVLYYTYSFAFCIGFQRLISNQ